MKDRKESNGYNLNVLFNFSFINFILCVIVLHMLAYTVAYTVHKCVYAYLCVGVHVYLYAHAHTHNSHAYHMTTGVMDGE